RRLSHRQQRQAGPVGRRCAALREQRGCRLSDHGSASRPIDRIDSFSYPISRRVPALIRAPLPRRLSCPVLRSVPPGAEPVFGGDAKQAAGNRASEASYRNDLQRDETTPRTVQAPLEQILGPARRRAAAALQPVPQLLGL